VNRDRGDRVHKGAPVLLIMSFYFFFRGRASCQARSQSLLKGDNGLNKIMLKIRVLGGLSRRAILRLAQPDRELSVLLYILSTPPPPPRQRVGCASDL
jgi:hypothetical protein